MKYEYALMMWPPDGGDAVEEVYMTRSEHGAVKKHVASLRKGKAAPVFRESGSDLLLDTPDCTYGLEVWKQNSDIVQQIQVTREEYVALKAQLWKFRGSKRAA
jgi:hypothetical protein